jgi:hypothetical protein
MTKEIPTQQAMPKAVTVRLSNADWELFQKRAAELRMSVSALVRLSSLRGLNLILL